MSEFLSKYPIQSGPFEPTWESLRQFKTPDWFCEAKLGIWAHWGPQCVPMYGDWYARHMYCEGHPQYLHHWRNYGHPSKFGHKDLVKLWKAEKFDPEGLMDLYKAAGAKYFFAQAAHHDNFDNWNSKHNRWNSTKIGPMRDICADWKKAATKRGLKFGISEHLGASFTWWAPNKGADKTGPYAGIAYDGNDPANVDLYHDNSKANKYDAKDPWKIDPWYTTDVRWQEHWLKRVLDMIDQLQPDMLYSDGPLPWDKVGLTAVAHLYNVSAKLHGGVNQAVYNQKDTNPDIFNIGVLDIERGQKDEAVPFVWQTDTCVGGWYYDVRQVYKTANHVIEMFVDIVAKNGCLLLNFTQKPDGTLDDENLHILKVMADWIKINGGGIYSTQPWKVAMEGPTRSVSGHFKEDAQPWTTGDFRFTAKGNDVYAFQMRYPESREAFIRNLGTTSGVKVSDAILLGYDGKVSWRQLEDGLLVKLPEKKVVDLVPCIKVTVAQG
jgi:alpha-L-fucosidase